ncbi:hypothetical protein WA158_004174 [Blastocystis sp. Blastoise]
MKQLLLFAGILALALSTDIACSYKSPLYDVTYDLTSLANENGDYIVQEANFDGSTNRTWTFNICNNVKTIPRDSNGGNSCDETEHDSSHKYQTPAPVFISNNKQVECSRGASDITVPENYNWYLADSSDPAYGVSLTLKNGDYCKSLSTSSSTYYRTVVMTFICKDTSDSVNTATTVQAWDDYCMYNLYVYTVYGCPVSCPHSEGVACGHHGMCGFDSQVRTARCFCNSGYGGDDCASKKFIGLSASTIFYILNGVALLAVICTIVYIWNKLHKLKADPDADISLEATFNQLGQYAM